MSNRARYTVDTISNACFYQMPKFLFEEEMKRGLSNEAKVLYSLLKDRHDISLKNKWINENDEVYLIFSREEMADMLGCSPLTLRKAIHQLKQFGLIEEERLGLNKANRIYLSMPVGANFADGIRSVNFLPSRTLEINLQEGQKLTPNKTNVNKTKKNNNNPREIQGGPD